MTATTRTPPPRPLPPSPLQLEQIAFFSPTSGYGMFSKSDSTSCSLLVGPTHDGGAHFGPLTQVTPCGPSTTATQLAFNDHGDGFVFNPGLFVTYDGGELWAPDRQPGTVLSVEALGYSVWMVEADCQPASNRSCTLRLFESADGGVSWAAPLHQPLLPATAPQPEAGYQTWLLSTRTTAAYVITSPAQNPSGAPDAAALAFTDDGGRSWSNEELPCGSTRGRCPCRPRRMVRSSRSAPENQEPGAR